MRRRDLIVMAAEQGASGGTYVSGDVNVGGDFVGRDKLVTQTNIYGEVAYDVAGLASPYLGLSAFTYDARDRYAGREREVEQAVAMLTEPGEQRTVLFITGASGSGKSSFAQAGLLPALEAHYAALGLALRKAVMTPSTKPLAGLAQALRSMGLPADDAFAPARPFMIGVPATAPRENELGVLIVDQFEELFVQSVPDQRDALFAILANLPPFPRLRIHILCTFRADYLPELFRHKALYDLAKQGIDLRKMSVDALKRAIQRPLQSTYPAKRFEPSLLDRLATDAAGEPTYLPLLQVTLDWLWAKGSLTPIHYKSLVDAFQAHADSVLEFSDYAAERAKPRSPSEQQAILDLLLDLVSVSQDDDSKRDARQRRTLAELTKGDAGREAVVRDLAGAQARLLSMGTLPAQDEKAPPIETVDIVHESLINQWGRLRDHVRQWRERLQHRARFELQVREWEAHDRSDAYLLSGVYLEQARELQSMGDVALQSSGPAQQLLRRSVDHAEARQRAQLRRQRVIIGVISALLVAAVSAAVLALNATQEARLQAQTANSLALAAQARQAFAEHQPQLAIHDALAANAIPDAPAQAKADLYTIGYAPGLKQVLDGHNRAPVNVVAYSPDGRLLASGGLDNAIALWDASTGDLIRRLEGHTSAIRSLAFAPDGKHLLSGSTKDDRRILLWDVDSGAILKTFTGMQDAITGIAVRPDGRAFATGSPAGSLALWDIDAGAFVKTAGALQPPITAVAYSADRESVLAVTEGSAFEPGHVLRWNPETGDLDKIATEPLDANQTGLLSLAVGEGAVSWQVATGAQDRSIIIRDADLGAIRRLVGHTDYVFAVSFSHDGRWLASGSADKTVRVWDVVTGEEVVRLDGAAGIVHSVAWSPDGRTLASGGRDGVVRVWDTENGMVLNRLSANTGPVTRLSLDRDGRHALLGSQDGKLAVWDVAAHRLIGAFKAGEAAVIGASLSPDAARAWSVGLFDVPKCWRLDSQAEQPGDCAAPALEEARQVALSGDGLVVAYALADGRVIITRASDAGTAATIGSGVTQSEPHLTLNSDGTRLVLGRGSTLMAWDLSSGAPKEVMRIERAHADDINAVALSADAEAIFTAGSDNMVRSWSWGKPDAGHEFSGHTNQVNDIAVSRDGNSLLSAADDKTAILWDVNTGRLIRRYTSHRGPVTAVTFLPAGDEFMTGSRDGTLIHWRIDPGDMVAWVTANRAAPE